MRILRLGGADNQLRMTAVAIDDVDTLNGLGDGDNSLGKVNVLPFKSADLANAHTSRETYQYAEVAKVEVFTYKSEQSLLVGDGEDFHFWFLLYGWKLDVPFLVSEMVQFHSVTIHHFQDNQQVLHGFAAQPLQFVDHKLLHIVFNNSGTLAKGGEKVVFQNQRVSLDRRELYKLAFVIFPHLSNLTECFLFCHNHNV